MGRGNCPRGGISGGICLRGNVLLFNGSRITSIDSGMNWSKIHIAAPGSRLVVHGNTLGISFGSDLRMDKIQTKGTQWSACTSDKVVSTARGE